MQRLSGHSNFLYGDAMLVPIQMGTNMAAGNQQNHLSLNCALKRQIYLSKELKNVKIRLFLIHEVLRLPNTLR